jgi:hypothetical protein
MVRVQHVLPATPFRGEIVVEAHKPKAPTEETAPEAARGRLVTRLSQIEKDRATHQTDRSVRRETYLVESGEREAALKLLEQRLGTTSLARQKGLPYSHEILESYLRCRFMVFDHKEEGKIDMSDFGALLGLLRDGRESQELEAQLMILDVDGDGMVSYLELVRWWLREETYEGEAPGDAVRA